jgi:hypothetical protein
VEGREPTLDLLGQDRPVTARALAAAVARASAAGVASALLLAGCTTGGGNGTAPSQTVDAGSPAVGSSGTSGPATDSPSGEAEARTETAAVPEPPRDNACYRLDVAELTEPSNA